MSDIFISYASEDRGRIMPLVRALEKKSWSVDNGADDEKPVHKVCLVSG